MSRSNFLRVLLPVALAALVLVLAGLFYWRAPAPLTDTPSAAMAGTAAPDVRGNERSPSGKGSGGGNRGLESSSPSGSPEERRQALIRGVTAVHGRQAASLLTQALRDPDPAVRQEALQLSAQLAEVEVDQAVLPVALQDEDPRMRDLAIHRVNELPVTRRIEFFAGALSGVSEEMAAKAAEWLGVLGGKASVEAMVNAWPRVAGQARSVSVRRALERLTGRSFTSSREAQAWWAKTAPSLDKDLLPMAK